MSGSSLEDSSEGAPTCSLYREEVSYVVERGGLVGSGERRCRRHVSCLSPSARAPRAKSSCLRHLLGVSCYVGQVSLLALDGVGVFEMCERHRQLYTLWLPHVKH